MCRKLILPCLLLVAIMGILMTLVTTTGTEAIALAAEPVGQERLAALDPGVVTREISADGEMMMMIAKSEKVKTASHHWAIAQQVANKSRSGTSPPLEILAMSATVTEAKLMVVTDNGRASPGIVAVHSVEFYQAAEMKAVLFLPIATLT